MTYLKKSIIKTVAKLKSTEACWCVGVGTKPLVMDHHLVSCSKWWLASFHAGEGEIERRILVKRKLGFRGVQRSRRMQAEI